MPFMDKAGVDDRSQFPGDAGGRNWMAPDSYIYGLGLLADGLSKHFPEDKTEIMGRKEHAIREVKAEASLLLQKIKQTGIFGKSIIASSMQKELLEWMGFRIAGEYGRPEAMSTRELVRLSKMGRDQHAIIVVDNLQSGPDAGKGIAETLGLPHVVLTNFPSEKGYLATLGENVDGIIAAAMRK
jgi:zinc transport system substrate-binding protein